MKIGLLLILIFIIGCTSNVKVEVAPVKEKFNEGTDQIVEIEVVAKQFSFNPNPILVNEGENVRLILTTEDVEHGFAVKEYGINEKIMPGETTTVEFTADKTGEFEVRCSVSCGSGHSGMKGKLIVR